MYSELKAYVRSCDSCQRNKTSNQKPIGMLKPLEIPTERFEHVSMDFITTLPVTKENHDAVMVIVDKLTKLVIFIPTRTDMGTMETAKKFFNHWCRWFGWEVHKQIFEKNLQANTDEARNVYKSPSPDRRTNGEGK
jgi:hypothetical protein